MATLNGGPYLNAAVLCEKVLQEKDETISIIRIIDRVTVTAAIAMSPEKKPPAIFNLLLLISLRGLTEII